jgi:hypothetical protein
MLHTLLNAFTDLCKVNAVPERLSSMALDTIFFIWIHTKRNTQAMWDSLKAGISSIFHFMEPIKQTKLKLIQLTLVIKSLIYPQKKKKEKSRDKSAEFVFSLK